MIKDNSAEVCVILLIFLPLLGERSDPHTGVFNRDIYIYICQFVCLLLAKMRRRNYVAQTRACSKSVLGG